MWSDADDEILIEASQKWDHIAQEQPSPAGVPSEQQSTAYVLPEQQRISDVLPGKQSTAGVLPEEQITTGLSPEQQSSACVLPEQQSTVGVLPEQHSTAGVLPNQQSISDVSPEQQIPKQQSISGVLPEQQSTVGVLPDQQINAGVLLEEQITTCLSPEQQSTACVLPEQQIISGVSPEQQSISGVSPKQQSTAGVLPEQQNTAGVLPEQQSISGLSPEQQSISGVSPEQQSTAGVLQEQQSTAGVLQEQQSTAGVLQEQQSTAGLLPEQQNTAGLLQEQQSTEGVLQEQQTTAGLLPKQQNTACLLPEQQNTAGVLLEQQSISDVSLEQQSVAGVSPEQQSTACVLPEQQSTAGVLLEQQNTAGVLPEQQSMSKKRKNRKRRPTRTKLIYISTDSDDDVPLSVYAKKCRINCDSGSDEMFVPNSKDVNSTDSEYSCNLSESSKRIYMAEKRFKKEWNKDTKHSEKAKLATTSKKTKLKTKRKRSNSDSAIHDAVRLSFQEEVLRTTLIAANEGRVDQILNTEGYERIQVPPHGNCFFEAACVSNLIPESPSQLRKALCKHLEDNILEYMGFLINKHAPESQEEFVCEYLSEIEHLKEDGYWSNRVADLLPLAFTNYATCTLTLFTSKPDQPKIIIEPNLVGNVDNRNLNLAYISIPSVLEHYDACRVSSSGCQTEMLTATKVVNEQDETHTPVKSQTPKKAAKFVSPVKKHLFRKKKAMPQNWKKNVRKRLRISGEEYIATTGKMVKRKDVKECNCAKCKYKCNSKVSFEQRCAIRDLYYGLTSYERQVDFLCSNVQEKTTKSYVDDTGIKVQKRKQVARSYSFVVNDESIRVCKKFFLSTISISQAIVNQALSKKVSGHFQGKDERGRHRAPNKTSDGMLNEVRAHIESFPIVDSHYTRKSTKRQFLPPELNIKRMYEAYILKCAEKETDVVKEPIYRRVFNEEYNLSFHVPKKDQCSLCNRYNNVKADGTLNEEMKKEYLNHQQRKTSAREQKYEDSNKAKQDNKTHTCTFDLQSVLYTPCSLVSLMYYMRKLCCYNLSVYSAGDKTATCFLWSEIDGKRGSNEISTCLNLYLSRLNSRIEHVILYSDACPGQNRNQIVATSLLHSVSTSPTINTIDHKFLDSGHTHMECDSMHSAIEFAKSKTKIFVPSQWETVLSMARRKNPYHVVALKNYDFKDFKAVKSSQTKATKTEQGTRLKWTSMKWMRFLKNEPDACFFKYSFDNTEEFQKVKLVSKRDIHQVQPLYKAKLPISSAKKKDLITLCKQGIIPTEYQDFYRGLSASQSVKERLPEPDKEESDADTDVE